MKEKRIEQRAIANFIKKAMVIMAVALFSVIVSGSVLSVQAAQDGAVWTGSIGNENHQGNEIGLQHIEVRIYSDASAPDGFRIEFRDYSSPGAPPRTTLTNSVAFGSFNRIAYGDGDRITFTLTVHATFRQGSFVIPFYFDGPNGYFVYHRDADADVNTDADDNIDADANTDADDNTDADANTDADDNTDADANTDTDGDADAGTDTGTDADAGTGSTADADPDTGANAGAGADRDVDRADIPDNALPYIPLPSGYATPVEPIHSAPVYALEYPDDPAFALENQEISLPIPPTDLPADYYSTPDDPTDPDDSLEVVSVVDDSLDTEPVVVVAGRVNPQTGDTGTNGNMAIPLVGGIVALFAMVVLGKKEKVKDVR